MVHGCSADGDDDDDGGGCGGCIADGDGGCSPVMMVVTMVSLAI